MKLLVPAFSICLFYILSAQKVNDVSMFRGNPQLTGVYKENAILKLDGIAFSFTAMGPIRSTPAIYNGKLFFGSSDGFFYATDQVTGKELWRFKTNGNVNSSPAVSNGIAYFTSRDHFLYALQTSNGRVLWKYKMGDDIGLQNYWDFYLSSPAILDQILYIGSGDGNLYAFDLKSFKLKWKFNAHARIRTTPAILNNSVIFGSQDGFAYSIRKDNGEEQWKFATTGAAFTFEAYANDRTSVFCSPSVKDSIVVIGGRDGFVYGLDFYTGQQKWKVDHKGSWILSTAIDEGTVYVGSGSAFMVQALDLRTGVEKWRFKTRGAVFSSITIAGNMLYFGDLSGTLYGIDKMLGNLKWSVPMSGRMFSTPVVANGIIYSSSDDGRLFAFKGALQPDTTSLTLKKIIYREGMKTDSAFSWFQNNEDSWIRNYFVGISYQSMDATELENFMKQQGVLKYHSVVVFADNKMPSNLISETFGKTLVRKYLDAGGKIVFFGENPLAYRTNETTGVLDSINYSFVERVFGIKYPNRKNALGYYAGIITDEGKKWGLISPSVIGLTPVDRSQVTNVLSEDDFGMADLWLKNYDGQKGTGLLQLSLPRTLTGFDIGQYLKAIEYGVTW